MITFNNDLILVLKTSEQISKEYNNPYVSTEHFLLSMLKTDTSVKNICNKNNLYYKDVKKYIKKNDYSTNNTIIYTPLLKKILYSSIINNNITLNNTFIKMIELGEGIALSILDKLNININKLYNSLNNNHISFGINLNIEALKYHESIIERDNELKEIIEVLCRKNKNNPLLIGNAGVGKTAIVEELANRINKKEVPEMLYNKQIISIDLSEIISGTRYRGEFEDKMHQIIKEFENNNNYILFIDEIHTLIGAGGAEGAIDASNILKPYLARNKIKCIGATTINEYNKTILNDKALNRRFYKIIIDEPNKEQTISILNNTKKYFEDFHKVHITKNQIKLIVELSNKHIKDKYEPDKSLDILDKICTKAKLINTIKKDNINELINIKNNYIKEKKFKDAIMIKNKINSIKTNKITVDNMLIKNCFNNTNNSNIGFNIN